MHLLFFFTTSLFDLYAYIQYNSTQNTLRLSSSFCFLSLSKKINSSLVYFGREKVIYFLFGIPKLKGTWSFFCLECFVNEVTNAWQGWRFEYWRPWAWDMLSAGLYLPKRVSFETFTAITMQVSRDQIPIVIKWSLSFCLFLMIFPFISQVL